MSCLLCFGVAARDPLINITSARSRRLNIAFILYTHFRFCFPADKVEGNICQSCWTKLLDFHEFYTYIGYMHGMIEGLFDADIDNDVTSIEDPCASSVNFECPTANTLINVEPTVTANRRCPNIFAKLEENSDMFDSGDSDGFIADSSGPSDVDNNPEKDENFGDESTPKTKRIKKTMASEDRRSGKLMQPENEKKSIHPPRPRERCAKPERTSKAHKRRNASGAYQCKACDKDFMSFYRLTRHVKETHDAKPFKCEYVKCVESFETEESRAEHMTMRHKHVECPHCHKMILEYRLDQHFRDRHEESNSVCCELCGKVSANKKLHKDHYGSTHQAIERLKCDICGTWYKNKQMLRRHMRHKHIYGAQTCPICNKVLADKQSFAMHKKTHMPETLDRYRCDICGHGFRGKARLQEHYHIHTGSAGSYQCNDCGRTFRFSSSFSVHKKKMHPK